MNLIATLRNRLDHRRAEQRRRFAATAATLATGTDAKRLDLAEVERLLQDLDREPADLERAAGLLRERGELRAAVEDQEPATVDLRAALADRKALDAERSAALAEFAARLDGIARRERDADVRRQAAEMGKLRLLDVERELRSLLGEDDAQQGLDSAERARAAAVAAAAQLERDLATARRQVADLLRTRDSRRGEPAPGVNFAADIERAEARVADIEQRLAGAQERQQQAEAQLAQAQEAAAIS